MRDPKRIPDVLEALGRAWLKSPDLRLCQLISNAIPPGRDGFFLEDEELVEILKHEWYTGGRKEGIAKNDV